MLDHGRAPRSDDRIVLHGYIGSGGTERLALEGDVYQCFWFRHRRLFRQEDTPQRKVLFATSTSTTTVRTKPSQAVGLSE